MNFILKMGELRQSLPNIRNLNISPLLNMCPPLSQFLLHCTPNSLRYLSLNDSPPAPSFPCDANCSGLVEIMSGVTEGIDLEELQMNRATFEAVMRAACHVKKITFYACKLDCSEELDFSGVDYR